MLSVTDLPTVNALLNSASATFLIGGYWFIRHGKISSHRSCMFAALACSALFLTSYLIYHYHAGSRPFTAEGWVRPVYFSILISHTILAMGILPLVLVTVFRALRGHFQLHARIARWTLPIWLYISVTGVIIYLMLYQLY